MCNVLHKRLDAIRHIGYCCSRDGENLPRGLAIMLLPTDPNGGEECQYKCYSMIMSPWQSACGCLHGLCVNAIDSGRPSMVHMDVFHRKQAQHTQLDSLVPPEATAAVCFEKLWPSSLQRLCAVSTQPACTNTCPSASCSITIRRQGKRGAACFVSVSQSSGRMAG